MAIISAEFGSSVVSGSSLLLALKVSACITALMTYADNKCCLIIHNEVAS
jgi:hypothetical protein